MKVRSEAPRRGRPRNFDPDEVLDRAMRVFWRKGYAATSLSDLTAAMGINRASLYATFGNKESLFQRVLDRYTQGPFSYFRGALEAPTAREVVERLLQGSVNVATDPRYPPGCLWVRGALSYGDGSARLRQEMWARNRAGVTELEKRLTRAIEGEDLPADADAGALARFVQAVRLGMAVQAASGTTRAELAEVVQVALQALPESVPTPNSIPIS